ncbi:MAG TPA: HRDC domain-containing protein [Urbifossiella sp.]|jgi:superfamily II DNA helicase RecQ|nr:HRDC domain-containing protein [Urbifossiella sp.]
MKLRIFSVPTLHPDAATADVNAFLGSQRIVHVERQFVADGANSFWSVCVSYVDGGDRPAPQKGEKVDYREVLPAVEFAVFAKLRTLRKELSEKDGVPAYALFTNEQLADMVRQSVTSITALRRIKGVGAARADKYGTEFVKLLVAHLGKPATPAAPPGRLFLESDDQKSRHPG